MADTEVARAVVTIVPSMEGAQKSITEQLTGVASSGGVTSAGQKIGSTLAGGLGKGLAVAGAATTAVAGAVAGASAAFVSAAGDVASYGDSIDKMSQKVGISAEAYQEWDFIAQHSGTSMESLKTSFKTMANAAQDGKSEFEQLGISLEDAASMSTEDLFSAVISGLQGMEEGTERTAIASALLGKGATELGALLNTSAADTEAMRQQVHDLGGVMSDEAVKSSAAYQDSLQNLQTGMSGLKNNLMAEFLPGITSVMDGLTAIVSGDSEGGLAMVEQGVNDFVANLSELAPKMLEIGASVLGSFAQAIIDNLPTLLESGMPIIMELVNGIVSAWPKIWEVGLQVILELANSISKSLPDLIPTIVDVTLTIVETLIDNVDLLIDAAIALIIGLAEGLINALPRLIEKIPVIVEKLVSALIENAPKLLTAAVELIVMLGKGLLEAIPQLLANIPTIIKSLVTGFIEYVGEMASVGVDLVKGIWDGIKKEWENLTTNVKSLGKKLVSAVKGFFEIGSPSKLFSDEVGQWIPKGIAVGIDTNADSVTDSIDNLVKDTMISPSVSMLSSGQGLYNPTMSASANNTNANGILAEYLPLILSAVRESGVTLEGDARQIFNVVRKENNQYRKSHGGVSALI